MGQRVFFILVFVIQAAIAALNYYIAIEHRRQGLDTASKVDILCGISWTATALYKLWEAWMV